MQAAIIFAIGVIIGCVLTGVIIGCVLTGVIRRVKSVGKLRIDTSDPDGPFMFLELSKGVGDISSRKQVLLEVDLKSYISHE